MIEMLHSRTSSHLQPGVDTRDGGINPYALGFAMIHDIRRICIAPTDEDREWFPEIAGQPDPVGCAASRLGELSR